ncbi:MAG: hypothetical protein CMM07_02035 [Rhodopirellula sp.]|nr:hypothetical protein [Rhodopirellula sp.]
MNRILNEEFDWQRCPTVATQVAKRVDEIVREIRFASCLRRRMKDETGTRFTDWVDHLCLPFNDSLSVKLEELGYVRVDQEVNQETWRHPRAMVPAIRLREHSTVDVWLKVDSVSDFLQAHDLDGVVIGGEPAAQVRTAMVAHEANCRLAVIERHGEAGFQWEAEASNGGADVVTALAEHRAAFFSRPRVFTDRDSDRSGVSGFEQTHRLLSSAIQDLGTNRVCDLFFESERCYWESRNHAARVQRRRQGKLGLGWANHDHHTYRSSRESFAQMIGLFELLGLNCRERFYGGAEAGWGAQVLEQPHAGIVIFADVDLSPDEVTEDFAHDGLVSRGELGTVGLWCKLHGEAIFEAGMHHLECQFDFDAACVQLADVGIRSMKPFTDFEYLRQAFTVGEIWKVDARRLRSLREGGQISSQQEEHFFNEGSVGSHLEILQRDEGYKGFNQTGISEIILATDPRHRGPA